MSNHGLTDDQIIVIQKVLKPFTPPIQKVALFGSRATGRYKPESDIDLVLYGDIPEETIDRISTLFSESLLSLYVDVQAYNLIAHIPLKTHIDRFSEDFLLFL